MMKKMKSRRHPPQCLARHLPNWLALLLIVLQSIQSARSFLVTTRDPQRFSSSLGAPRRRDCCTASYLSASTDKEEPQYSSSSSSENEEEVDRFVTDREKFLQRNKHWVIIVDDEQAIRLAVGDYLYDAGYQITACADADALLEVCSKPRSPGELPTVPDAIVSDVRMPGKDGIALTEQIRADERLKRVPVILLTAKGLTQDRIAGYKAGADVYLPKPFNPDELLSILDNAIARRSQMTGENGSMINLKQEMANIKQLMKQNSARAVQKTDIYLTPAERQVLELVSKGYTNAEIAAARTMNVANVSKVISKLYELTGTKTRTELVRWGMKTGYVAAR